MKKIILLAIAILFASSSIAFAQTSFKVQAGEYFQHFTGNFTAGSKSSLYAPTNVSTSMLGLSNTDNSLFLTAIFRAGSNKLSLSYNPVSYSGTKTSNNTFIFEGNTYLLTNKISSKISFRSLKLFYFYNFKINKYIKVGPGIGIDNENISVAINDITTNQSEQKTVDAPIPLLAADVIVTPITNLHITGKIQGISYSGNSYYYIIGKAEYNIQNRYSVFAEYVYKKLTINIQNVNGGLTFNGPIVGVGVKF
jgi:hypothetical protein